ncbi:MAG TPA: carboxypeptidase-like regulatory domain-containing protein [Polyangia bacterium]|nr:carboxypeptidase-like regulatory domain-containing protein [Polyangia bacterium]
MKKWRSSLYLVAVVLVGCGGTSAEVCTKEARPSLQVTVLDAVSGRPVCDADVAVTTLDGTLNELLAAPGPTVGTSTCNYYGPYERPGRFLVMAGREGYQSAQQSDITVTPGSCHVQTVEVTLRLMPTPQTLLP